MFNISKNGIITITKGDTFNFTLYINAGDDMNPIQFPIDDSVKVLFRVVYPNKSSDDYLLEKLYTKDDLDEDGNIIVDFTTSDTADVNAGKYYYEVKVIDEHDNIVTVIPRRLFYIDN